MFLISFMVTIGSPALLECMSEWKSMALVQKETVDRWRPLTERSFPVSVSQGFHHSLAPLGGWKQF